MDRRRRAASGELGWSSRPRCIGRRRGDARSANSRRAAPARPSARALQPVAGGTATPPMSRPYVAERVDVAVARSAPVDELDAELEGAAGRAEESRPRRCRAAALNRRICGIVASPTPTVPISSDSTSPIVVVRGTNRASTAAAIQPAVPPPTMTMVLQRHGGGRTGHPDLIREDRWRPRALLRQRNAGSTRGRRPAPSGARRAARCR